MAFLSFLCPLLGLAGCVLFDYECLKTLSGRKSGPCLPLTQEGSILETALPGKSGIAHKSAC